VIQQTLKKLPSCPNALRASAEDVVYSMEFFHTNCLHLMADVLLALLKCEDLFSTIYLLKFPTNKSKDVKSENRADNRTRTIMRHCSETYMFRTDLAGNRLLKGVPDSTQVVTVLSR
jgi:hypothetical protein